MDMPGTVMARKGRGAASNENAINWNAALVFLLAGALPAK